jgi:hypothetical protein
MDELRALCVRLLGDGPAAAAAEEQARAAGSADAADRLATVRAAVTACREHGEDAAQVTPPPPDDGEDLAGAVARELAGATGRMAPFEREALALRDLLWLSHEEIATVAGLSAPEVALLLARSRLELRTQLRGASAPVPECPERERALRTIALRQDGEAVAPADDEWLIEHLGHCAGCGQAHASMLEAVACYRAWDAGAPAVA